MTRQSQLPHRVPPNGAATVLTGAARAVGALVAVLLAAALPWPGAGEREASATAPGAPRFVTGWVPYYGVTDGLKAITGGNEGVFAEVSPFSFMAAGATDLRVVGGTDALAKTLTALRAQHLPVVPTITDGTPKLAMAAILDDPITRAQHVQALVALVVLNNFDGIDLDYEGFAFADGRASWPTTRPDWVAFIQLLGPQLHAQGRLLSVTVPAIWDGGTSGYTVYDWSNIIGSVDRLRIMTYDWSVAKKGPIAPLDWDTNVLSYITSVIPAAQLSKVQLGVPAYGRSWAEKLSGTCPSTASLGTISVQMENASKLAADHQATPVREAKSDEMMFTYDQTFAGTMSTSLTPAPYVPPAVVAAEVDSADSAGLRPAVRMIQPGANVTCTVRRTVYYPDAMSVKNRADAALAKGLSGIAIWALGYESADLWPLLATSESGRPAGTAVIGHLDAAHAQGGSVGLTGWAIDPEFDLPITVQVSVNGGAFSGPILAGNNREDLPAAIAGADPLHGFEASVPIPTNVGDNVCIQATGWGLDASPTTLACMVATA